MALDRIRQQRWLSLGQRLLRGFIHTADVELQLPRPNGWLGEVYDLASLTWQLEDGALTRFAFVVPDDKEDADELTLHFEKLSRLCANLTTLCALTAESLTTPPRTTNYDFSRRLLELVILFKDELRKHDLSVLIKCSHCLDCCDELLHQIELRAEVMTAIKELIVEGRAG